MNMNKLKIPCICEYVGSNPWTRGGLVVAKDREGGDVSVWFFMGLESHSWVRRSELKVLGKKSKKYLKAVSYIESLNNKVKILNKSIN